MRTTIRNRYLSVTLPSVGGLYGRNHHFQNFHETPGEGGGGTGEGEGGEGGGEGTGDGQEAPFHEFKEPTERFKFPGMAKAMTVKEYQDHLGSNYMPKQQYDGTMKVMGQIATLLTQNKGKGGGNQGPGNTPNRGAGGTVGADGTKQARDIIAELEGFDGVMDGKQMAGILRHIQETVMKPQEQLLLAMGNRLQQLTGHVGNTVSRETDQQLSQRFGGIVGSLKLPQVEGGIAGSEALTEMVRDFYWSLDDNGRKGLTNETFAKEFGAHFKSARTFFRNLEKSELTAAQTRAKNNLFPKKGASSSANGGQTQFRSNRQLAEAMFAANGTPVEA